jgi:hypothetical protein
MRLIIDIDIEKLELQEIKLEDYLVLYILAQERKIALKLGDKLSSVSIARLINQGFIYPNQVGDKFSSIIFDQTAVSDRGMDCIKEVSNITSSNDEFEMYWKELDNLYPKFIAGENGTRRNVRSRFSMNAYSTLLKKYSRKRKKTICEVHNEFMTATRAYLSSTEKRYIKGLLKFTEEWEQWLDHGNSSTNYFSEIRT